MRYLDGTSFSVAVGSKKITAEEWARIFGKRVENATAKPSRLENRKVTPKK